MRHATTCAFSAIISYERLIRPQGALEELAVLIITETARKSILAASSTRTCRVGDTPRPHAAMNARPTAGDDTPPDEDVPWVHYNYVVEGLAAG